MTGNLEDYLDLLIVFIFRAHPLTSQSMNLSILVHQVRSLPDLTTLCTEVLVLLVNDEPQHNPKKPKTILSQIY